MLMPLEIARMEEARQARAMTELGATYERIMGGVMAYLEPGSWANQACGIGLEGEVTQDEVDRLVAFYVSRGVEPRAEVAQFADESLLGAMAKHGFELRQFETVLVRLLDAGEKIEAAPAQGWPVDADGNELVIEAVDAADEPLVLESWRVSMSGFLPEVREPTEKELAMHRTILTHPHSEYLVAKFGGKVVGAGYPRGDDIPVGVLFGVSVLDAYRKRGVQQALILHRVRGAQARGAKIAVIHSLPGASTDRNSMRLGFGPCYSKAIMAKKGEGLMPSP